MMHNSVVAVICLTLIASALAGPYLCDSCVREDPDATVLVTEPQPFEVRVAN